ncbi:MAG: heavy-metal-associated domain-containing protein [Gammaproteobacteria bacterium]|nr:heavy-metal-associated domain-containing protein [Gammaproteobacteria bacterium]
MQTEQFTVKNVKCGGCISNIETGLKSLPGVSAVSVTIESGLVVVSGDALERAQLAQKLATLGYPEA